MSKIIRHVVTLEYEPKPDHYADTPVEFASVEEQARWDARELVAGNLHVGDWDFGSVKAVTTSVMDSDNGELDHILTIGGSIVYG